MLNSDVTDTEISTTVNNTGGVNSAPPASTEKPPLTATNKASAAAATATAVDAKSSELEIHQELEPSKAAQ